MAGIVGKALLRLEMFARAVPSGDYEAGAAAKLLYELSFGSGVGDNQFDTPVRDDRQIAGASNEDVDIQTILAANGIAANMVEVAAVAIVAESANGANLTVIPSVANGWTNWLTGGTPSRVIRPGGCEMSAAPAGVAYLVTGSNLSINVDNPDAAAANYTIILFARSA